MENETPEVVSSEEVVVAPAEPTADPVANAPEPAIEPVEPEAQSSQSGEDLDIAALLDHILEEANKSSEPDTQTKTETKIGPNFDDKPVTEKELEELNAKLAEIQVQKEQELNQAVEKNTALETELATITAAYEAEKAEAEKAKAFQSSMEEKWLEMEQKQPVLAELTKAFLEGKEVDLPGYMKSYYQKVKEAATAGAQSQVVSPSAPQKKSIDSIYELSNLQLGR